jgi:hypothetical protein
MANTILVLAMLLAVVGGYMHWREWRARRQGPVSVTVIEWGIPVQVPEYPITTGGER